ncbi:MAG: branched-chain amino acid ABC transporter permease [Solirubrobacteraceae bacterium]
MTELLQLCFAGTALGARYALVALGFVIVYRATGVINFAQGGLLALGAYLAFSFNIELPFAVAVLCALLVTGAVGAGFERLVLRRMVDQPVFAVIMITIGLLFVIEQVITTVWGFDARNLRDPWGIETLEAGGVVFALRDLWTLALAAAALGAFFALFRFSKIGVAMRAAALDQEAALAQGISAGRVQGLSWALAGVMGALAGVMFASGPAAVDPTIGAIALVAFPAVILGGLDSPTGAVLGGLIIGIVQSLTAGYQDDLAPWLGSNFAVVMPYVVMVLILLVRPYGLLGTKEVQRV